jgi:hypothetical protein
LFSFVKVDAGGGSGEVEGGDRFEGREINDFERSRF